MSGTNRTRAAILAVAVCALASTSVDARIGRMGIHPNFGGGGHGFARPGAGGAGERQFGGGINHGADPGWDRPSMGPPRPGPGPHPEPGPHPGPGPNPGPGPGPGPHPGPGPGPGPGPHPGPPPPRPYPYPYPLPPPLPPPIYGWGPYWGWDDDDFAVGLVAGTVTGAVVATAANSSSNQPVGTIVTTLPANCSEQTVKGITYEKCGKNWFEPQFTGTSLTYKVIPPPK